MRRYFAAKRRLLGVLPAAVFGALAVQDGRARRVDVAALGKKGVVMRRKGVVMRRRVALLAGLAAFAAAAPAAAQPAPPPQANDGGAKGSCGLGPFTAHDAIDDTTGPGASEAATVSPVEFGCTGPRPGPP
jgi:hypothetical protein